jgi:hypothetical protein
MPLFTPIGHVRCILFPPTHLLNGLVKGPLPPLQRPSAVSNVSTASSIAMPTPLSLTICPARDASKRRAYRQVSSALPFVPMSVEFFGRLGAPALTLLGDLAAQAVQAGRPGLSRAAFISGALRELSVALCRGNASLCRSGAYVATRAAGRTPMRGLARPSHEVV